MKNRYACKFQSSQKNESRKIPQKLAARLKFVYCTEKCQISKSREGQGPPLFWRPWSRWSGLHECKSSLILFQAIFFAPPGDRTQDGRRPLFSLRIWSPFRPCINWRAMNDPLKSLRPKAEGIARTSWVWTVDVANRHCLEFFWPFVKRRRFQGTMRWTVVRALSNLTTKYSIQFRIGRTYRKRSCRKFRFFNVFGGNFLWSLISRVPPSDRTTCCVPFKFKTHLFFYSSIALLSHVCGVKPFCACFSAMLPSTIPKQLNRVV